MLYKTIENKNIFDIKYQTVKVKIIILTMRIDTITKDEIKIYLFLDRKIDLEALKLKKYLASLQRRSKP